MKKIEYHKNPNIKEINFLTKKINEETPEYGDSTPFAFFIRDEDKQIIAGANGFILYGKIYTDQLWVDPKYRRQGLARQLMEKVHNLATGTNCSMATISTMSFQHSIDFYKKLGYIQDFERLGHIKGSSCIFMRKDLTNIKQ